MKSFRLSLTLLLVIAAFGTVFFQLEKWAAEVASPDLNDADQDGIDDTWEIFNHLNPHRRDGAEDVEGDGLTNLQEFRLRTLPRRADSDRDGMPDGWEVQYRFKPRIDDGAGDADSDGLSNVEEFRRRTHPHEGDTDGDGLPDGWEVAHQMNPRAKDAFRDDDYDGQSALAEFRAGTDPTDYFNGVKPIITVISGEGNPDGEFVVKVHRPDGTPYANAPVTFDVPPEEASLAGNPDSTILHQNITFRTKNDGTARVYLRPPVGSPAKAMPNASQVRLK